MLMEELEGVSTELSKDSTEHVPQFHRRLNVRGWDERRLPTLEVWRKMFFGLKGNCLEQGLFWSEKSCCFLGTGPLPGGLGIC